MYELVENSNKTSARQIVLEQRENNLKVFKTVDLKAKAGIWL